MLRLPIDYQKFQAGLKSGDLKNTNGQLETLRNQFFYLREQTAYFAKEYVKARGIVKKNPIKKMIIPSAIEIGIVIAILLIAGFIESSMMVQHVSLSS